jgi:hypothetical protein
VQVLCQSGCTHSQAFFFYLAELVLKKVIFNVLLAYGKVVINYKILSVILICEAISSMKAFIESRLHPQNIRKKSL